MAGSATAKIDLGVTGLGTKTISASKSFTPTAPVEVNHGYVALTTTTEDLDFGGCALAKSYGVYLEASGAAVYVVMNHTSLAANSTNAHAKVLDGQAAYIPINPDNNAGIRVAASTGTAYLNYVVLATT
jgi:hypothetical protein